MAKLQGEIQLFVCFFNHVLLCIRVQLFVFCLAPLVFEGSANNKLDVVFARFTRTYSNNLTFATVKVRYFSRIIHQKRISMGVMIYCTNYVLSM